MKCIFCKQDSSFSRSVEHIVPESLGNKTNYLKCGIVCDNCNNYFSRKVEKPFLESDSIKLLRFHQSIPSKRGRIPPVSGVLSPGFPVNICRALNDEFAAHVFAGPEAISHILNSREGTLIFPESANPPTELVVSRFMAKMAIEAMAQRLSNYPEGIEYITSEPQLDQIRDHARRGTTSKWPVHMRRIYNANQRWIEKTGEYSQMVHEYDILHTNWNEWFFVAAFFGLELAINYGGPDISGYLRWIDENNGGTPLYSGGNLEVSLPKG